MRRAIAPLVLFAAAVLSLATLPIAHAQTTATNPAPFAGPRAQTNNPVSMVIEHKNVQTLADGTHITSISHESFYRDSLGRTRTETENMTPPARQTTLPHSVNVLDPVAGVRMSWTAGTDTAPKLYTEYPLPITGGSVALRAAPPTTEDSTPVPSLIRIAPPPPGSPPAPGTPAQTTPQKVAAQSNLPRPAVKHQDLGSQTIEGVVCQAQRTTTTYPENYFNNDRAITVTTESCFSRELNHVLMDKVEDPRSGVRTTTLKSISRTEPDVSLFQPPADYTERPRNPTPSQSGPSGLNQGPM
jgi:hypothetical protein